VPSKSHVLAIKIQGSQVSEGFPFDKVYLARKDSLPDLLDSFPYCLSFPMESTHAGILKHLRVHYTAQQGLGRAAAPKWVGPSSEASPRDSESGSAIWGLSTDFVVSSLSRSLADFSRDTEGWSVVIPVLTKYTKKSGGAKPAYLVTKKLFSGSGPSAGGALSDSVSLHRRGSEPLSPPCLACSRLMSHLQGDCELGNSVCYESMSFDNDSYFQRGLELQKLLPHMTLLEAHKLRASQHN
jgi:hypothetical protein